MPTRGNPQRSDTTLAHSAIAASSLLHHCTHTTAVASRHSVIMQWLAQPLSVPVCARREHCSLVHHLALDHQVSRIWRQRNLSAIEADLRSRSNMAAIAAHFSPVSLD